MNPTVLPWALSGAAAVAVGFARFAYALILPAMQSDLNLNYAQAGWLNTANALGYLLGALATIGLVGRYGNRRLFTAGVVLTTLALILTGLTRDFTLLAAYRFLAGLGAAGAFICGGVLAGVLGTRAIVVFFSGSGIGMLSTGAALPWLFEFAGNPAWPWAWVAIGAACVPLSLFSIAAARQIAEPGVPGMNAAWRWQPCVPEFTGYFLFGLGYIAYITFIIAWLRQNPVHGLPMAAVTSIMWSALGVMTLLAPIIWRRVFNGRSDGVPMAATMSVLGAGAVLPMLAPSIIGVWISAALVGASVFMVPAAATSFVKANLPRAAWGSGLAVVTSLFAIGQTIGPVGAGWISDKWGSLSVGLGVSAALLFAGALVALIQRPCPQETT
ncbi:MAG: YbfB/YjiJ family MFS transporter [Burkholderiaceae bacterium]